MIKREFLYLGWYLLLCIPIIILYVKFSLRAKREWLTLVGQIRPQVTPGEQEREYMRLEFAFPVEFQKEEEPKEHEFNIHQGFTKNISKSGMCIETLTVRGKKLEDLIPNKTKLKLIMNIPSEAQATIARATVRWVRKTEDMAVDRYYIGVSYDDIAEPDLEKIIRYVLWFRRKPDIFAISIIVALVLIVAFISTTVIFRNAKSQLENRVEIAEGERLKLAKEVEVIQGEKDKIAEDLKSITRRYATLRERLKSLESEREYQKKKFVEEKKRSEALRTRLEKEIPVVEKELTAEAEEAEPEEETIEAEETLEPVVELREPTKAEDEIVFEPNITRKMVESEKEVYKTFRDHILEEDIQLLDRYASLHRTSIYHAAGLFALAELRYKNRHIKEMTMKAYRDVISLYPNSKYASYASHRLEQIKRNLPYQTHTLGYYYREYNLPSLFDYRELEPYKE